MGYWTTKVLPKIKKVFEKNSTKKTAAAEVSKTFDESKVCFLKFLIFMYKLSFFFYIFFIYVENEKLVHIFDVVWYFV